MDLPIAAGWAWASLASEADEPTPDSTIGLSQVDTFGPKPALDRFDCKPMPAVTPNADADTGRLGTLIESPFALRKHHGRSGIEVSELRPRIGGSIDDFCLMLSRHTDVPNHERALFMMNCGALQPGRPSMGSWITHALGTANHNLPGFVVLCPGVATFGPPLRESAFLPAVYQETPPNLAASSLAVNACLITGAQKYVHGIAEYTSAGLERPRTHNGISPGNSGLSGEVGEYHEGGVPFPIASSNDRLGTPNLERLNSNGMNSNGTFPVHYKHGDKGWFSFRPLARTGSAPIRVAMPAGSTCMWPPTAAISFTAGPACWSRCAIARVATSKAS